MKDTMAGNGIGNVGGAAEASAKDNAPARYEAGQVVLAEVDHVRAYRGETDELLYRMRTAEAEEEFMVVLDGLKEPDWFMERWDGERKVLVACLVFERAEDAGRCAGALAAAVAAGTAKAVRLRDDEGMRGEVAEWFSAKWAEAHEAEMAKVGKEYEVAVGGYGPRILVGWVGKDSFEGLSALVRDATGLVAHAAVKDEVLGRVNVCLGFRSGESAAKFMCVLAESGFDARFAVPRADMEDEVPRQMVVAMARRLRAHDAKKSDGEGKGEGKGEC